MTTAVVAPFTQDRRLVPIHGLLSVQSLVIVLLSVNRLTDLTTGYVAANQFLRWVDLNNMLVLPLVSLLAFYLLKKEMERGRVPTGSRRHLALNLAFVVGVYLMGASYGNHEVTNYLHTRFCPPGDGSDLCRIVVFNDDEFSHWVFFSGFVLVNASLLLIQDLFPRARPAVGPDMLLLMANGLFIALGIFANLAFEPIGLDLYVVALLALLALALLRRRGKQPLFVYYATAYTLGLAATAVVKALAPDVL